MSHSDRLFMLFCTASIIYAVNGDLGYFVFAAVLLGLSVWEGAR